MTQIQEPVHLSGHSAVPLPPGRLFIDGDWRDAVATGRRDVIDPATGSVITTVADGGAADIDAAVTAAGRAFDEGPWPRMSGRERGDHLLKLAEVMKEHREELARLESLDTGKPIVFARMVDLGDAIDQYTYYGSLASTVQGATRSIRRPGFAYTRREPLGVVGAISPFNFPLILSSTKIAPALAAGNTVVHKPAEDTPLTALRLAELFAEAGLPPGVLNVVTGGAEAGAALVRHPGVHKIGFTGSTATGTAVAAAAAEGVKPATMELGGKSAQLIFADAELGRAIECAVNGFVFNTGQFCMGGTRLLVHRSHYETVLGALAEAATHVPVGDPRQESTIVGPLAGLRHLENVERYVALGEGRVVAGGRRLDIGGGYYYAPTVLADVANDARVVQEEVFGPVLTVQPFDTEDEAVALANSTRYGLAAALHTNDLARAHRVAARLRAGIVWVNSYAVLDAALPFGGVGHSGYGRENGPEGLDAYLQTKSVYMPTD
ncbi:aldehyde dehydrogenase family protein [Actinoplanes sp. NEAU-A12]|uniref:Aldehyde dehydrogenase family protein n=1 Tax=Actinoplanes sandaracinus TaxID=3045177 RepID=A0ABT6WPK3_9ACTN|nr:aldehyde dehydrogenase family protein [Actinoplanes sandaracinus]MDI6101652.1 aldehyde dehydrogenase family protein [Actinoplanes sandaracinus]